jgi:ATP diphosphatase
MSAALTRLLAIMARLRDPGGGCAWDLEQDFASIAPYTIEEAYEVADAIERRDYDGLRDELGDLLLQVVFHAQMAAERGLFDFDAVAAAICDEMVRRHPHVFADARAPDAAPDASADAAAQSRAWEEMKADERRAAADPDGAAGHGLQVSALAGVPAALPALTRALKLQRRAADVGFDWPDAGGALAKLDEEIGELAHEVARAPDAEPGSERARLTQRARIEDELGDVLFSCVNVCRKLGADPEAVLRGANAKFERRFQRMEANLGVLGRERLALASLEALERWWALAKAEDDDEAPDRVASDPAPSDPVASEPDREDDAAGR